MSADVTVEATTYTVCAYPFQDRLRAAAVVAHRCLQADAPVPTRAGTRHRSAAGTADHRERVDAGRRHPRGDGRCPVTAAGAAPDELREAVADTLPPHQSWCQTVSHSDCCARTADDCDCGVKDALDALLPVVTAWAENRAERRWLLVREAHDWQCDCGPDDPCRVRTALTSARANALDGGRS